MPSRESALLKPMPSHCCHKARTPSYISIVNGETSLFTLLALAVVSAGTDRGVRWSDAESWTSGMGQPQHARCCAPVPSLSLNDRGVDPVVGFQNSPNRPAGAVEDLAHFLLRHDQVVEPWGREGLISHSDPQLSGPSCPGRG